MDSRIALDLRLRRGSGREDVRSSEHGHKRNEAAVAASEHADAVAVAERIPLQRGVEHGESTVTERGDIALRAEVRDPARGDVGGAADGGPTPDEIAQILGGTSEAARRAAADGVKNLRKSYPGGVPS